MFNLSENHQKNEVKLNRLIRNFLKSLRNTSKEKRDKRINSNRKDLDTKNKKDLNVNINKHNYAKRNLKEDDLLSDNEKDYQDKFVEAVKNIHDKLSNLNI